MDKKTETVRTYNSAAAAMARKFDDIGARVQDIEKGFSYVQTDTPKVLEIGCGNGRDAKEILKKTNDYLGVDISEPMVQIAREHAPEGRFQVADIEVFSFPKNIDLIFSFASLLHSTREKVKAILKNAHEALSDNGVFFISLKYDEYHESSKTDEFGTRTYYFYTPEIVRELAGEKYSVIAEDTQNLRGQKWFTIILKKKP